MKLPITLLLILITAAPVAASPKPQDWVIPGSGRLSRFLAIKRCEKRVNRAWERSLVGAYAAQAEARTSTDPRINAKLDTIETAIVRAQYYQAKEVAACQFPKK